MRTPLRPEKHRCVRGALLSQGAAHRNWPQEDGRRLDGAIHDSALIGGKSSIDDAVLHAEILTFPARIMPNNPFIAPARRRPKGPPPNPSPALESMHVSGKAGCPPSQARALKTDPSPCRSNVWRTLRPWQEVAQIQVCHLLARVSSESKISLTAYG
jgi:hypothetical protein